ncbi:MAG TPA: phage tail protein I, partial [Agrobacterium sp.]|nr:phage tail protein I [Agrobacterium sp.]
AAKRHSQDIAIQYGVRGEATLHMGAAFRRGRTVRIMAPQLGDAAYSISTFAGTGAYALRSIRINAKAA